MNRLLMEGLLACHIYSLVKRWPSISLGPRGVVPVRSHNLAMLELVRTRRVRTTRFDEFRQIRARSDDLCDRFDG
jgi:hypothetical protein